VFYFKQNITSFFNGRHHDVLVEYLK